MVDDAILILTIPTLPVEKQTLSQNGVDEIFRLRKQSKRLLECAQRSVEIAIEQDEPTAIDYLENKTKEASG